MRTLRQTILMFSALALAAAICLAQQYVPINSGAISIDLSGGASLFKVSLNQNITSVSIPGTPIAKQITVLFIQNATGGYTVSGWASNILNASSLVIASGANASTVVLLTYDTFSNTWTASGSGSGGGGGTPGGLSTQYQINNAGVFAGATSLSNSAATGVGTVIASQAGTGGTDIPALRIVGFPTSPASDKFQIAATGATPGNTCAGTTNCAVWVDASNNWNFLGSNLQLSTTSAPPYLYLNGIQGNPGQPYLETSTARLNVPTSTASNTSTGGTVAANTYFFKVTWVNPAGETTGSTETSTTTTGTTSTITLTAPGAQYSAFGYQIYESTTSGAEQLVVPTSSNCTLSTATFGGNAVCAPTSAATFTTTPAGASISVPTSNTTGGAYIDAFAPAADGLGLFVSNGAPGADAPVGAGISLTGGTGLNLTSGTTTTAGTLACLSGSETASQCASSPASGVVGVFVSSGQNALVQTGGIATINLAAAATTTYNHYACASTSGTIVDSATPCSGVQQVGIIAQTNAVSVTSVPVFLMTQGAGAGGCSNCLVQNPTTTAANTITPGNTTTEGLTINGNGGTSTSNFDVSQNGFNSIHVTPFGDLVGGKDVISNGAITVDGNTTGNALDFAGVADHITFAAASNDIKGTISITSSTSGSHSFGAVYTTAPTCIVTQQGLSASPTVFFGVGTTTSAVTVYASASGTYTVGYVCWGNPN